MHYIVRWVVRRIVRRVVRLITDTVPDIWEKGELVGVKKRPIGQRMGGGVKNKLAR